MSLVMASKQDQTLGEIRSRVRIFGPEQKDSLVKLDRGLEITGKLTARAHPKNRVGGVGPDPKT
jgi:hypothetical protein